MRVTVTGDCSRWTQTVSQRREKPILFSIAHHAQRTEQKNQHRQDSVMAGKGPEKGQNKVVTTIAATSTNLVVPVRESILVFDRGATHKALKTTADPRKTVSKTVNKHAMQVDALVIVPKCAKTRPPDTATSAHAASKGAEMKMRNRAWRQMTSSVMKDTRCQRQKSTRTGRQSALVADTPFARSTCSGAEAATIFSAAHAVSPYRWATASAWTTSHIQSTTTADANNTADVNSFVVK